MARVHAVKCDGLRNVRGPGDGGSGATLKPSISFRCRDAGEQPGQATVEVLVEPGPALLRLLVVEPPAEVLGALAAGAPTRYCCSFGFAGGVEDSRAGVLWKRVVDFCRRVPAPA